jgi:hypothetical protein
MRDWDQRTTAVPSQGDASPQLHPSATITAVGIFLFFAAIMAAFAGFTLLWPGTYLDRAWILNTAARDELRNFGRFIGVPFLVLSAALVTAGVGWLKRRGWGWRLAVAIIAIQLLGDGINALRGRFLQSAVGLVVAGALLFCLLRRNVRAVFDQRPGS